MNVSFGISRVPQQNRESFIRSLQEEGRVFSNPVIKERDEIASSLITEKERTYNPGGCMQKAIYKVNEDFFGKRSYPTLEDLEKGLNGKKPENGDPTEIRDNLFEMVCKSEAEAHRLDTPPTPREIWERTTKLCYGDKIAKD